MKQITQNLRTGATNLTDVPSPAVRRGTVLIRSTRTLVSAGTERMLLEFGKAGWIEKARQQPERVRLVLDKVKSDGLLPTIETVMNKLDQPLTLGYCNVGIALETGAGVSSLAAGDRVASNGKHAEIVNVAENLCAKIPANVSDDEAAFTVIAAIGLQGIRLAAPTLGEAVVVTGLGLIGLVTVQLLTAQGCRVLGIDFDSSRLELAKQFGAEVVNLSQGEDPVAAAGVFSRGRGVDAVLITASTHSSEPVQQAARMCRKRGRIVLVGVTGMELSRAEFFEKELTFQVSCSYGPGRYDANYEEKGIDYPVGYVRWTEQRNFEAVLDMMASGRLDVKALISHRFSIDRADGAYALLGSKEPSLGILLDYASSSARSDADLRRTSLPVGAPTTSSSPKNPAGVAFVGAGNYASAILIPAFKSANARLTAVVSSGGVSGAHAGRKFGFERVSTDADGVFDDDRTNAVVIATRHDSHAQLASRAIRSGKHVFVEKPLALTLTELASVEEAVRDTQERGFSPIVMVGFNRRFAPHIRKIKSLIDGVREPKTYVMTVNAGAIPANHWIQDPVVGGGRILGEGCHYVDLLRFLSGSPISGFQAMSVAKSPGVSPSDDKSSFSLRFADGSIGTVLYMANGHKSFPKERLEVFAGGRILQLDNFRKLVGYGWNGFRSMNLWRQDKGQSACADAFVRAVESGGPSPIPFTELLEVSRVTIEVAEALRSQ